MSVCSKCGGAGEYETYDDVRILVTPCDACSRFKCSNYKNSKRALQAALEAFEAYTWKQSMSAKSVSTDGTSISPIAQSVDGPTSLKPEDEKSSSATNNCDDPKSCNALEEFV